MIVNNIVEYEAIEKDMDGVHRALNIVMDNLKASGVSSVELHSTMLCTLLTLFGAYIEDLCEQAPNEEEGNSLKVGLYNKSISLIQDMRDNALE